MTDVVPFNPGSSLVQNYISGTKTADVTGNTLSGCDKFTAVNMQVTVASIGGTSPTLNVYLQQLAADGSKWYDIASMTQITANGDYMLCYVSAGSSNFTTTTGSLTAGTIRTVPMGRFQRVHCDLGGTSPTMVLTVGLEYIE